MKTFVYNLAHARSGDKGDICNIGVIARRPEYYPTLLRELTIERVRELFGPWCSGDIERYELENLGALNFVIRGGLDGGALSSLRLDSQGKTYGYAVLGLEIAIPDDLEYDDLLAR